MTRITANTTVSMDGTISCVVKQETGDRWETLGRAVIQTRDDQVRQSLIDLGWTPPQSGVAFAFQAPRAMAWALLAHHGQVRKYTGEHYFHHLAEVAGFVASVGGTDAMICASWLHDSIEDCGATRAALTAEFGVEVSDLVWQLSDTEQGNRAARKEAQRVRLAKASDQAQTIKCADLVSNACSIRLHDSKFAPVFMEEARALLAVMTRADPILRRLALEMVG